MKEYEMNDVRLMRYFLGIQVKQKKYKIFISQEKNVDDLLKKFSMFNCKSASTPMRINEKLKKNDSDELDNEQMYRSLVGSLLFLTNTRPNIMHVVSVISRHMDKLSKTNLMATMIILKHVKGTKNFNVKYEVENDVMLIGYLDSNWTSYQNDKEKNIRKCF